MNALHSAVDVDLAPRSISECTLDTRNETSFATVVRVHRAGTLSSEEAPVSPLRHVHVVINTERRLVASSTRTAASSALLQMTEPPIVLPHLKDLVAVE